MRDILQGIELFNNGGFFEAHDFFEECWLKSNSQEKKFYQGLVHLSVACFHLVSGNKKGSISQFNKAILKLKLYYPIYHNVELEKLLENTVLLKKKVEETENEINPKDYWDIIPKIRCLK